MKIELKELTIQEVSENYIDNQEEGVIGYNGKLNIRPKYQREFVYDDKKRDEVVRTINKKFPLNVMYWAKNSDGTYEVLDGQQRTISFCRFADNQFSIDERSFQNLTPEEKNKFLNYKLMIYICEGEEKEKLDWFEIINIAGEKLTPQELKNAVYTGTWLTSAKTYFSKNGCPAYGLASKYISGSAIRQDYLETALTWISKGNICKYMSEHQHAPNANELWTYFKNVIDWVKITFPTYRKEMKGINWGDIYDNFNTITYDTDMLESEIKSLMMDDDVTNKKGIYYYVLTKKEKHLSIRAFTENQKRIAYEKQNGICSICKQYFELSNMEGDHITPWHDGGKTSQENCTMLCKECNRRKGGK